MVLIVLGLAQLMDILDSTIVNIALPTVQRDSGFPVDCRQRVLTGYALAFGSLLLLGGRLPDFFGRKRLFLIGVGGFAVASAFGGAAWDFTMLLAARIAQGAFAAMLAPAALSLLSVTFAHDAKNAAARSGSSARSQALAGTRAAVGWRPHPRSVIAVVPVREPDHRSGRLCQRDGLPARRPSAGAGSVRHRGHGHGGARPGRNRLRSGQCRDARLERRPDDRPGDRGRRARSRLRADRTPYRTSVAVTAGDPGPGPRDGVLVTRDFRDRDVRGLPVPQPLPREHPGIHPAANRNGVPPDDRLGDGGSGLLRSGAPAAHRSAAARPGRLRPVRDRYGNTHRHPGRLQLRRSRTAGPARHGHRIRTDLRSGAERRDQWSPVARHRSGGRHGDRRPADRRVHRDGGVQFTRHDGDRDAPLDPRRDRGTAGDDHRSHPSPATTWCSGTRRRSS